MGVMGIMWMWTHLPRWHSAPRALDPLNHAKRRPGTGRLWFLSNCPERLGYIWNRKVWSLMAGVSKMTATWIHRIATADVQFLRWLPAKASEVDTCHRVAEDQRKFSHVCWWYSGLHCRNVLRNFAHTVWGHMYMQVSTHIMPSLPQPWRNLQLGRVYVYIYIYNILYIYIHIIYTIYIHTTDIYESRYHVLFIPSRHRLGLWSQARQQGTQFRPKVAEGLPGVPRA